MIKRLVWKLYGATFGNSCNIGKSVRIVSRKSYPVRLGNNVELAQYVEILTLNKNTKKWLGKVTKGPVTVGDNVFIGENSIIMPNVTIGNNVVIIDHSIVFENMQDNSVVGGIPARVFQKVENFEYSKKLYKRTEEARMIK